MRRVGWRVAALLALGALLSVEWNNLPITIFLLFGLGFSAGFFDVPLAALIQLRSPASSRGGVLMTANMLTWVGIFAAGALFWLAVTERNL